MYPFHLIFLSLLAFAWLIAAAPALELDAAEAKHYPDTGKACMNGSDCATGGCCVWPDETTTTTSVSTPVPTFFMTSPTAEARTASETATATTKPKKGGGGNSAQGFKNRDNENTPPKDRKASRTRTTGQCQALAADSEACSKRNWRGVGVPGGRNGFVSACPCGAYLTCVPYQYEPVLGDYNCAPLG